MKTAVDIPVYIAIFGVFGAAFQPVVAHAAWAEVTDPGGAIYLSERKVTGDHGLLLSGTANALAPRSPSESSETDGFFAVLDGDGQRVLHRRFDDDVRDEVVSAESRADGGWLLLRHAEAGVNYSERSVLHALNIDGSDAWQRRFDSPDGVQFNEVSQVVSQPDGDVFLYESWGNFDALLGSQRITRLRSDGTDVWQRTFPASPRTRSLLETRLGDDRLVLVQRRFLSDSQRECVATGIDTATGETAWEVTLSEYGNGTFCHGFHVHQGRIRGFIEHITVDSDISRVLMVDASGQIEVLPNHALPFVTDMERGVAITPAGRYLFLRAEVDARSGARRVWFGGIDGEGNWMQWSRFPEPMIDHPFRVLRANDQVWSLTTDFDDSDAGRFTDVSFFRYDGQLLGSTLLPAITIDTPNSTNASIVGRHLLVVRNADFRITVDRLELPGFSDGMETGLLGQ